MLKRFFVRLACCVALMALPCAAFAAAAAPATKQQPDPLSAAGLLAMGLGVVLLAAVLYMGYFAVFVHLATRIVGLRQPFATAFSAVFLNLVLQVVFGLLVALFAPRGSDGWYLAANWAAAIGSIMAVYEAGVFRALAASVLSVILTVIGTVVTLMAVLAILAL